MTGPAEFVHGPMLIGTMINIFLYGIMITQVYIYYTTYKRDHMFIKIFVFALLFVDAINTVFEVVYIYICLIPHFGDAEYLETINWMTEIGDAPSSTGVITLMVQLFYAWRIHVLTRNWFLVAVVALLSFTSAAFAIVSAWETIAKDPHWDRIHEAKGVITVWLTCAVTADVMITAILVRHLVIYFSCPNKMRYLNHMQRKHRSGFQQTDMMVNRIIRVTMQTCLITTVLATVDLTLYLSSPSGTHMAFMLILSKLYSNSLVSNLNSRGGWKYDTAATPECESNFVACGASNPTQIDFAFSQQPTEKPETNLGDSTISGKSSRTGVFAHGESRETQDRVLRKKDPEA